MPSPTNPSPATLSETRLNELEKFIRIDKNDLDTALEQQSAYFLEVTRGVAEAISHRDRAKADLEFVEAEEDRAIRELENRKNVETLAKDDKAKVSKMTEGAIKALIIEAKDYQDAKKLLILWNYLVQRWDGLKEAFSQRHYALRELSSLWIAGYYRAEGSAGARSPTGSRSGNDYNALRDRLGDERRQRAEGATPQGRERL